MRIVTIKFEEDLLKDLDEYANSHGLYRLDVVRIAVKEYLAKHLQIEKKSL